MKTITRRIFRFSFAASAAGLIFATQEAPAAPLAINNPNFATPTLTVGTFTSGFAGSDWVGSAGSDTGVFDADGSAYYTFNASFPSPGYVPDGMNVGYIRQSGTISQDLTTSEGDTWTANSVYTLSGDIGSRSDDPIMSLSSAYVEILESSVSGPPTVLAEETLTSPATGTWGTWSLTYDTPAVAPTGDMIIALGFTAIDDDQVNYTGISLTDAPIAAPDGGTTALLLGVGCLGLVAFRRKRLCRSSAVG